nr:immunoglobulin heavy chain junction region [Macaca mulatta]
CARHYNSWSGSHYENW